MHSYKAVLADLGISLNNSSLRPAANAVALSAFPDLGPAPPWIVMDAEEITDVVREFTGGINEGWFADLDITNKNSVGKACLDAIDNRTNDSYERWRSLLFAAADAERLGATEARRNALEWSKRGASWTDEAAFDRCWNSARPGGIGVGTLIYMAEAAGLDLSRWRNAASTTATPSPNHQVQPGAASFDMSLFYITNQSIRPEKRKPILGGLAFIGNVSVVASPGGVAKSTIIMADCVALASGRQITGVPVPRSAPVLMINAEDTAGEVRLRVHAYLRHYGMTVTDAGKLFVAGADQLGDFSLTELDPATRRERLRERDLVRLRQIVRDTGARLVVLDPFGAVVPVGGNDNGLIYALMRALRAIAEECGCAIVLVAHTRKNAAANGDGAEGVLGAVALSNGARAVWGVTCPSAKETEALGVAPGDEAHIRILTGQKANLSPGAATRTFRLVGVRMGNAAPPDWPDEDNVAVAVPFTPNASGSHFAAATLRDVLAVLARGAQGGTCAFSPAVQAKARSYVQAVAAALAAHLPNTTAPQAIRSYAQRALVELQTAGWVVVQATAVPKTGGGANKRDGYLVRWTATPWAATTSPGPFVA